MVVSPTVSRTEENTDNMSCQKSLPLSPTTQTAKTPVTYYHVLKTNISVALKTESNNPTDMLWSHYEIIECSINIHEFL